MNTRTYIKRISITAAVLTTALVFQNCSPMNQGTESASTGSKSSSSSSSSSGGSTVATGTGLGTLPAGGSATLPSNMNSTGLSASNSTKAYVEEQYRLVYQRPQEQISGDQEGVLYWAAQIDAGNLTRNQFRSYLYTTDEYFIRGLYVKYFGRAADWDGLKYYLNQIYSGTATRQSTEDHFKYVCDTKQVVECQ